MVKDNPNLPPPQIINPAEQMQARHRRISQAWDAWIASERGEKCLQDDGCYGEYLRNRLWHAFMAGADSVS